MEFSVDLMIPDKSVSLNDGAIIVTGWASSTEPGSFTHCTLEALAKEYKFSLDTPFNQLSDTPPYLEVLARI